MAKEEQPRLDSWDDFSGDWIKPDNVREWPLVIAPIDLEAEYDDGSPRIALVFEYNGKQWKMNINKTNQGVIRAHGVSPQDIKGKTLTFEKTKVRNPATNAMVDSFALTSLE